MTMPFLEHEASRSNTFQGRLMTWRSLFSRPVLIHRWKLPVQSPPSIASASDETSKPHHLKFPRARINHQPHHLHHTSTMIQRSLLRTSRALSSRIQNHSSFAPLRQQTPPLRILRAQLPSISASRWYSDAAQTNKEEPPATGEAKPAEADDPAKKELEAKKQEVVDLKVRSISRRQSDEHHN